MPIGFSLKNHLNPVFIETGLYRGGGVRHALAAKFPKIYSIEYEPSLKRGWHGHSDILAAVPPKAEE
jgi:hypothetical protein